MEESTARETREGQHPHAMQKMRPARSCNELRSPLKKWRPKNRDLTCVVLNMIKKEAESTEENFVCSTALSASLACQYTDLSVFSAQRTVASALMRVFEKAESPELSLQRSDGGVTINSKRFGILFQEKGRAALISTAESLCERVGARGEA